jgi:hypothetical protein
MLSDMNPPGTFVISLDFELAWGSPGGRVPDDYRANFEGVRAAIGGMLALFREFEIHATWAIVGLLFFRDRQTLLRNLPAARPNYLRPGWSPYPYIENGLGQGEADDPLHYAPSVIEQIAAVPHQEIGTHTFSHYYCLEPVQSDEAFAEDLEAAKRAAATLGMSVESLVFPINQTNPRYLSICAAAGIRTYRGNEPAWAYEARDRGSESGLHRLMRMVDSYVRLTGLNTYPLPDASAADGLPVDIPSSRFLRPYRPPLKWLEPLRLRRIRSGMRAAAREGRVYHLWWHPHNFGVHLRENLSFLRKVLEEFAALRGRHGMVSRSMAELAPGGPR